MADKTIGALPAAPGVYDDSLFVAEQQGQAVKITGRQLRSIAGGSGGTGGGDYGGGGYVEMASSIPVSERKPYTLYGLILKSYS